MFISDCSGLTAKLNSWILQTLWIASVFLVLVVP